MNIILKIYEKLFNEVVDENSSVFRSEPSSPPSHSQAIRSNSEFRYMETFKDLMKNKDYKLILITFGMSYGLWNCLGIIVNEIFLHFFPVSIFTI